MMFRLFDLGPCNYAMSRSPTKVKRKVTDKGETENSSLEHHFHTIRQIFTSLGTHFRYNKSTYHKYNPGLYAKVQGHRLKSGENFPIIQSFLISLDASVLYNNMCN